MARKVIVRRGLKNDLPILDIGELGYSIDTEELFIGSEHGNVLFAKKSELQALQDQIDNIKNSDVYKRLGISANGLLTIDGIEQQLGGGNGDMTLVVKDYFEGSTNVTKTYADNMVGFSISNDAGVSGGTLTFTINGITIPVKATETYEANFLPYKTVTINTTVPYRATVSMPYGATFDTIPPLNITGFTATNITTSDLTLSWVASTSSDVAGYDVYQGANLLSTITQTTYGITGLTPSTSYSFTIKARDNSGNIASGVSLTVSTLADTTPPENVTNLVASNVLATSLTLSWTASTSPDTTGYLVYNGSTLLTTVTGTTYNVTGLASSTNYTFTVKAKDGFNNISSGTSVSVTTTNVDTTAPNDVTGLTAGTSTINSIPVGWTLSSSNDVANYEVAYSTNGGTSWTIASSLINSSSTSYTITGLTSGIPYTIRVVAIDTSGNRSNGSTVVKATASSTSYTLSASPSSGTYNATQNVVLSATPNGATIYYTTNGTTPTTSSSVYSSPIVVSVNTTIKFFAQDGVGNATGVQTATYTIDTVAPTVTISPVAGTYSSTQSVTISANETATIYYTINGTTPTTSSTVYSAPISVTATETIKYLAVDTAGNQTTGSALYTIDTVAPDPVTSLTAGTVTSTTVPLTWTAPVATDVSKYEVAYSSDGGTNYTIATSSLAAPATSYTVTGLTASTTYTIRVVAIDGAGNRSTSVTVLATTSTSSTPPSNVTGLTAGTLNITSFNVSWTPSSSTNVANYEIAYSTDGTNYTVAGTVGYSVYGYTVTGLTANTAYTIRVVAIDNASNRSTGATVSGTTLTLGTTDSTVPVVKVYPNTATFASNKTLTVTIIPDETATVYYTLDNSTPTTSSSVYSAPLTISATTTLKYFAKDTSGNSSAVATTTYTKQTFATPNTATVTSGLLHSYDFSSASEGTTIADNSGTMPLTLTSYKTDGTEGLTGSGLRSTTAGYASNSTVANLGMTTPGSSFTVVLMSSLNIGQYSTSFFSSKADNAAINLGTGTAPYGRFQLSTTSVGALHVHPKVLYQDGTNGQITIVRSDSSTATSSINNAQAQVWTMTYDQPSKTISLYIDGTLSVSQVVTTDAKFDGIVINSGQQTAYALLVYNRVLSTAEITQVSNDLHA